MKILITGAAGFIGSAFARYIVEEGHNAVIVDTLTYAGDLLRLDEIKGKYRFYKADIIDRRKIEPIFKKEKPEVIVHFAAESHVDRSILDASTFIKTNVLGTQVLLDVSRCYEVKKFIHISTDEVFGDIEEGAFSEDSPLKPNSPYSASKAAADLLIKSYFRTYSFPGIIIRPSNNYGPWQYPEKLIPLATLKIIKHQKIPVYAQGKNIREWLYVDDCVQGVYHIMEKGAIGEVYNLGSSIEKQNIDVVKTILKILNADETMIEFVKDRPGHDIRYSLDSQKIRNEIHWQPKVNFEEGIQRTVDWCLRHKDWLLSKWENIEKLYK